MHEYPALQNLLAAHFHQDFEGTSEQVVDGFLSGSRSLRERLPTEIDLLLGRCQTEAALDRCVAKFGSAYYAPWDGGTYRGWLEDIARQTRDYNASH